MQGIRLQRFRFAHEMQNVEIQKHNNFPVLFMITVKAGHLNVREHMRNLGIGGS